MAEHDDATTRHWPGGGRDSGGGRGTGGPTGGDTGRRSDADDADSRHGGADDVDSRRTRRSLIATAGLGAGTVLAGCLGDGGGGSAPGYERVEIDADGSGRSAEQLVAAEAVAQTEISQGVTPLDVLSLADHEFVLEDGYEGSTVQGTVEHTGSDRIEIAEVRVRVYDGQGRHLGRYASRTGDLEGGEQWSFTVVVLQAPDDLAAYDVAVLGTPG